CSVMPSSPPALSNAASFSELPAKSVDLAAINLTELVNGMLNTALKGTKKFFSLLSITSYSSFAFHKVSVAIYNISNLKNVDPSKFPMRYCYCLNNMTNDLTDFTALLVDIIGNSTSYLTEIFKSTSIVSVSQSNDSDCIYICVMAGRTGRNMSDFWEMIEKSPVINYTFSSNMSALLGHGTTRPPPTTMESYDILPQMQPSRAFTPSVGYVLCLYIFSEFRVIFLLGCPQATLKEPSMNSPPVTFMAQKINPCVMELCKFFQQCLCVNQRRNSRKEAMRYCIEYYSWFLKNATYVCERVKRMAYSQTLKQKCLTNICKSV
uniref:HHLA1 neighbor of OC90 n=1 Tax=Terrapene triunguis TaxID=2587831 RepID=A0A674JSG6_9SAUR